MTKQWEEYYKGLDEIPEGIKGARGHVKGVADQLKEEGKTRVLDLGCGFGRHLIYLAEQGFDVSGIDISQEAVEMTKEKLEEENLEAEVLQADMKDLPFSDEEFDAVLAITVIGHATKPDIEETVDEVYRVLRNDGFFYGNLPSKGDSRYDTGEPIEEGETYRTKEYGFGRGMREIHSFYTKEEIEELFEEFSEVEVELFTLKNGEIQSFEIKAVK